jgi:hypothetical protein
MLTPERTRAPCTAEHEEGRDLEAVEVQGGTVLAAIEGWKGKITRRGGKGGSVVLGGGHGWAVRSKLGEKGIVRSMGSCPPRMWPGSGAGGPA